MVDEGFFYILRFLVKGFFVVIGFFGFSEIGDFFYIILGFWFVFIYVYKVGSDVGFMCLLIKFESVKR